MPARLRTAAHKLASPSHIIVRRAELDVCVRYFVKLLGLGEKGNSNYMSVTRQTRINLTIELTHTQNRLGADCSKVESVI